jgi:hypothetical protein
METLLSSRPVGTIGTVGTVSRACEGMEQETIKIKKLKWETIIQNSNYFFISKTKIYYKPTCDVGSV